MDDAELKHLIEQTGADSRRHFDLVAENLRRDVQQVAEGVMANSERLVEVRGRLDLMSEVTVGSSLRWAQ